MLNHYAIAIATGLTHEQALRYESAMLRDKYDISHLKVK